MTPDPRPAAPPRRPAAPRRDPAQRRGGHPPGRAEGRSRDLASRAFTGRLPRHLHPGAWWLWALGLAAAASRTTNPLLLGLLIAVAGLVVAARRTDAPWARTYTAFLALGAVVVVVRVVFQALFGSTVGGTVLVTLPSLPLPAWAAGVRIGGPVTVEALVLAAYEGLRLAAILACIGAANALADPRRLLRSMPGALYEAGVAVVVAMTFAPRLVEDALRIRSAQRLRGRPPRGLHGFARVAAPVLDGSLERALDLAAAMDARGFGRQAVVRPALRRATAALVLVGLGGVVLGLYGLLDGGTRPVLALALLGAGTAAAVGGFLLAGRRSRRTRYRPDPWTGPEWTVAASGALTAAAFTLSAAGSPGALNLLVVPLVVPPLPLLPTLGALLGLLPAVAAPQPPGRVRTLRPPVRTPDDRTREEAA